MNSSGNGQHQQDERLDVLNRLVQISLVLNSSLSTNEILQSLMNASAEILNAESASVFLMNPNTHELHIVAITTDTTGAEKLTRIPVPLDNSIAGSIVRENKNVVVDDVSTSKIHFRGSDAISGFKTRSILGVPMRIKDRVVGALEAVNKLEGSWTQDDVRYLEILASQASIALEKAQLVQELRTANAELSKVDKIKNDFIAIASHELRTPLGVILGYASFLKEEAEGELGDHANAVMNSALRMRNLIEDMTNLRLMNAESKDLEIEVCGLNDLMRLAAQDVQSTAEAKGHNLQIKYLEPDISVEVDKMKMITAFTNILNNAVKFTPDDGKIMMQAAERNTEIWIRVRDTGVGIPEENLTSIFKSFSQVEDHMIRRHGGMGLGLSIAKAVVEAHGGRIWAESEGPDQGSSFTISLPKS